MNISYCYMTAEDIPKISEMEKRYFGQPWSAEGIRHYFDEGLALFIVARDEKETVGYACVACAADEGDLVSIAVDEDYRQKGIAAELLDIACGELKKEGVSKLFLEVRESNVPARKLYEKRGFLEAGRRRGFYSNPKEDAVLYDINL